MGAGKCRRAAVVALVMAGVGTVQAQQVIDRNTTITGPRGNSINRNLQITRGPGYVDRNIQITRPGGATFDRNTLIQRGPVGGGGRFFPGPRGFGGPRFVENVYVGGGGGPGWGTALGIGGGLFGLGLLAGNAMAAPPPPPPVVLPPPVVVQAPPGYYVPPGQYAPPPPPQYAPPGQVQQVANDPVVDAVGRLSSSHDNSRREGCYTLGRLGDPRAMNALVDRLKNDSNKDVRIAAAWALGEISDPRSAVYLERAATYDKKREVRDAASRAYGRLPRPSTTPASTPPTTSVPSTAPGEPSLLPLPESSSSAPPPPPPGDNTPPPPPPETGYDSPRGHACPPVPQRGDARGRSSTEGLRPRGVDRDRSLEQNRWRSESPSSKPPEGR